MNMKMIVIVAALVLGMAPAVPAQEMRFENSATRTTLLDLVDGIGGAPSGAATGGFQVSPGGGSVRSASRSTLLDLIN